MRSWTCLLFSSLAAGLLCAAPDDAPAPQSWALIIAINDYEDQGIADLRFCVNDARALRDALVGPHGSFPPENVVLMTDDSDPELRPTRGKIIAQVATFLRVPQPQDTVLIYFSGHGQLAGEKTYLVPVDGTAAALAESSVSFGWLKEQIEKCPAKKKVLLLDCCHAGAGKAAGDHMPEAMEDELISAAEGLVTLASCGAREKSYEWEQKRHGVFTYYLVEALEGAADRDHDGRITAAEVNFHVWDRVRRWALQRKVSQTPIQHSSVQGDILLARAQPAGEKQIVVRPAGPAETIAPAKPREVFFQESFDAELKHPWSFSGWTWHRGAVALPSGFGPRVKEGYLSVRHRLTPGGPDKFRWTTRFRCSPAKDQQLWISARVRIAPGCDPRSFVALRLCDSASITRCIELRFRRGPFEPRYGEYHTIERGLPPGQFTEVRENITQLWEQWHHRQPPQNFVLTLSFDPDRGLIDAAIDELAVYAE